MNAEQAKRKRRMYRVRYAMKKRGNEVRTRQRLVILRGGGNNTGITMG